MDGDCAKYCACTLLQSLPTVLQHKIIWSEKKKKKGKEPGLPVSYLICWLSSVMVSKQNTPDIPMAVGMKRLTRIVEYLFHFPFYCTSLSGCQCQRCRTEQTMHLDMNIKELILVIHFPWYNHCIWLQSSGKHMTLFIQFVSMHSDSVPMFSMKVGQSRSILTSTLLVSAL